MRSSNRSFIESITDGPFFVILYILYMLFALGMFGAAICWFFDVENFFLQILTIAISFMFMGFPLVTPIVLCIVAYYMAVILDWGWLLSLCLTFPGVALMVFALLGNVAIGITNRIFK